ncbi:MAG: Cthe_2314 family HEPN domain-containing protein [Bacteroidota bacterium]
MNSESTPLDSDLLHKVVQKELGQVFAARGIQPRSKGKGFTTREPLSEKDQYVLALFRRHDAIMKTLRQFELVGKFLEEVPDPSYRERTDIHYPDYLQYHIENHFLRLTLLFDQVVDLVQLVHRIAEPGDKVFYNQVKRSPVLEGTKILDLLADFYERLSKARTVRNAIAHKGDFVDEDLLSVKAQLEILDYLPSEEAKTEVYREHLEGDVSDKIKRQQRRVANDLDAIAKFYLVVNVLLVDVFREQMAQFEECAKTDA